MKMYLWFGAAVAALVSAWDVHEYREVAAMRRQRVALERTADAKHTELQRARAELGASSRETAEAESQLAKLPLVTVKLPASGTPDDEKKTWIERVRQLKRACEQRPDQLIPEMTLLTDEDWLRVARDAKFETADDQRRSLAAIRGAAKAKFLRPVTDALQAYMKAHDGRYPTSVADLMPYFESPPDPAGLARYEVYSASATAGNNVVVREKAPVDREFDKRYSAIPNGGVLTQWGSVDYAWGTQP